MTKRLSPDDVARFEKDGYLFPIDVLSETEVADYRCRFDELTITLKNDPARDDYLFYKTNLVLPWVDELTHNSVLLDVIEDLVGSHILLWSCCFLIKQPRTVSRFTWHQDNLHWYLEPPQAVSAWIALSHFQRAKRLRAIHSGVAQARAVAPCLRPCGRSYQYNRAVYRLGTAQRDSRRRLPQAWSDVGSPRSDGARLRRKSF